MTRFLLIAFVGLLAGSSFVITMQAVSEIHSQGTAK